jgi:HK97 family phage prohead protease
MMGLAAPTNRPTWVTDDRLGRFVEVIQPGAFTRAITYPGLVPILAGHLRDEVLACEAEIWETAAGLMVAFPIAPARWARLQQVANYRALRLSIQLPTDLEDHWSDPPGRRRTIVTIPRILEVSVTPRPAYHDTWLAPDNERARRRADTEDLVARSREQDELRATC